MSLQQEVKIPPIVYHTWPFHQITSQQSQSAAPPVTGRRSGHQADPAVTSGGASPGHQVARHQVAARRERARAAVAVRSDSPGSSSCNAVQLAPAGRRARPPAGKKRQKAAPPPAPRRGLQASSRSTACNAAVRREGGRERTGGGAGGMLGGGAAVGWV